MSDANSASLVKPDPPPREPRVNSYVLFFAALAILVSILTVGALREVLQYNLFYLMAASLAVAILLAFIPLRIDLELSGLLRAGGAAAIFAFCFWVTKPFAEDYSRVQIERMKIENDKLRQTLVTAVDQLTVLTRAVPDAQKAVDSAQRALDEKKFTEASDQLSDLRNLLSAAARTIRVPQVPSRENGALVPTAP